MKIKTMKISGLILTYNGDRLIDKAVRSLNFCDYILIVDSFSTDKTVEIIENIKKEPEFNCKIEVLQNKWSGPYNQFMLAFENIKTDWIVSIDQDEIVSEELKNSLLQAFNNNDITDLSGFYTSRSSWYFNRFMRHSGWYPDHLLRVFNHKKMQVHVSGAHYSFEPKEQAKYLEGDIIHYPYENFYAHFEKINSYAQQGAEDLRAKNKRGGLLKGILHGLGRFVRLYFLKRGFLDGQAGFINAVHGAMYAFSKYLRVDEGNWGKPFEQHIKK